MDRGFLIFVQKNDKIDYLKQAKVCAMSIKKFNPNEKICLVTDIYTTKDQYVDYVIDIPEDDLSKNSSWKVENRCKLYDASPFKKTIVLDADMLILENIDHWWKALEPYELYYTNKVKTYRNEIVKDNYYRKVFVENELPNVYCGMHYFIKSDNNKQFYNLVKDIVKNYKSFSERFTKNHIQTWCSMDVVTAMAIKIMNIQHQVFNSKSFLTFTHMKPRIQNWKSNTESWSSYVDYTFSKDCELYVGNYLQKGIFHYVENNFLTDEIMEKLR